MDGCGGGVGDASVPCTWHKFDATQEYAVGCGVWGMMLTFLELAYMFDATQDYELGCGEWC